MAEDVRDVLMTIVKKRGEAIPAECQAVIGADDAKGLARGFQGNYFAVQDFTMEVGLTGDQSDPAEQIKAMQEAQHEQMKELVKAKMSGEDGKLLTASKSASDFARFMNQGRSAMRARSYSANLEPVSITKMLDASSLPLFKACINSTTLDSAVLIKRRGGGGDALRTYLRIEFTKLLITDFNWEEEDVIKEKIKFVCRKAEVQYAIENNDGTLKSAGQSRSWSVLNLSK